MGFFSDLVDVVVDVGTAIFSGGSGSSLIGTALTVAATVGSAILQSNANDAAVKAAQQAAEAERAAILQGNTDAQAFYEQIIGQSQPATDYLRSVVALDPSQLTPSQQTGFDDVTRSANANLAVSGLRGAGRAGVATVNEAQRRYTDAAYDDTQRRSDAAANLLSGQGLTATSGAANAALNTGTNVGGTFATPAEVEGDSATATADVFGQTLGALTSYIANENKDIAIMDQNKEFRAQQRQEGAV